MDRRLASEWEARADERVEATRQRHEELRSRLLNPKVRLTGRDESALQRQIREKEAQKQREKDDDRAYAAYLQNVHDTLKEEELRREEAERQHKLDTLTLWQQEAARKQEQHAQELQEYHRIEKHIGPSSAQKFDGEDVGVEERRRLQQRQMRRWAQEQAEARERAREEERLQEEQYAENMRVVEQHVDEVEKAARAIEAQRMQEVQEYNLLLAKSRTEREAYERKMAQAREERELKRLEEIRQHHENAYQSALAPHRVRPDHFCGLEQERLEEIRATQQEQIRERQARLAREQEEERAYARQQAALAQLANHVSFADQERRREEERATLQTQLRQAEEKRARDAAYRHEQKTERGVNDDFFAAFGRSHR
ncbi:RIB43A-like with coiled-coils protein 1 [Hondaea fermentalgiana]|uniref:RIB43A-like with coiled-coils protein 1 n=1 Tax=Hondaea fermentalgiana TaxID=2315210 RepID=A0A2R5GMD6_9STRA|nr:RIB43A-like with coiled-coils protein 1 [Hondaea fermentalgiana]|eukprot:GBG31469.1 RIB43A-like with coiled-coils protein 1 [Hondaea fermentalgiana]